jgi:hypothetical protein
MGAQLIDQTVKSMAGIDPLRGIEAGKWLPSSR